MEERCKKEMKRCVRILLNAFIYSRCQMKYLQLTTCTSIYIIITEEHESDCFSK